MNAVVARRALLASVASAGIVPAIAELATPARAQPAPAWRADLCRRCIGAVLGIKGLGELGNVGTNAAVANAVYHATGKRIRDLPIRLEQLLDAAV
jgi:CO/xanthine dehydrogenase Mo-binding subunit